MSYQTIHTWNLNRKIPQKKNKKSTKWSDTAISSKELNMHRLQHPQGNMTNTFRIPFYAKQRLLMRMNGKSCKSIWRVSLCSDLRLRSDELCCLPVSIGEKKSRGEWRFLHFKMLENTEQADRKKKDRKRKKLTVLFRTHSNQTQDDLNPWTTPVISSRPWK